jgi:hypothetical protein
VLLLEEPLSNHFLRLLVMPLQQAQQMLLLDLILLPQLHHLHPQCPHLPPQQLHRVLPRPAPAQCVP